MMMMKTCKMRTMIASKLQFDSGKACAVGHLEINNNTTKHKKNTKKNTKHPKKTKKLKKQHRTHTHTHKTKHKKKFHHSNKNK